MPQVNAHAVAMLLDGPHAYARELHESCTVAVTDKEGRTSHSLKKRDSSVASDGRQTWKEELHGTQPNPGRSRLMGYALWRQRLLQRIGWIVIRVDWQDWRGCVHEGGSDGKIKLLRRLFSEHSLML